MSRYFIVLIMTFITLLCAVHIESSNFDLVQSLEDGFLNIIKTENLDCSNYKKFCEKSNEQFQTSDDPKDISANSMAIALCEAILKVYVCKNAEVNQSIEYLVEQ